MPNQPTSLQIRERAERRCAEPGITKLSPGTPSYEAKERIYRERFDRQVQDAEIYLSRVHAFEQQREDTAANLERQREEAVLAGDSEFQRQLAKTRRRVGSVL